MKIVVENDARYGVRLGDVPFGSLVRRPRSDIDAYLVVSSMDGTGRRALVSLPSGNYRNGYPQDERVLPLESTLTIHGPQT